jgi:hypothetical protein
MSRFYFEGGRRFGKMAAMEAARGRYADMADAILYAFMADTWPDLDPVDVGPTARAKVCPAYARAVEGGLLRRMERYG